jgi:hypothetical protein
MNGIEHFLEGRLPIHPCLCIYTDFYVRNNTLSMGRDLYLPSMS